LIGFRILQGMCGGLLAPMAQMMMARAAGRRLRFNALEPGFTPNTGLGREANAFLRFLANCILPLTRSPHQVLEHPEESRVRGRQSPDRCIRSDRRLLR
jgi:hypothetical protein